MEDSFIEVYKTFLQSFAYELLNDNKYSSNDSFYRELSYDEECYIENKTNLNIH